MRIPGMVPFPMESRGEAVHAVGHRHFVFPIPEERPAPTASVRAQSSGLESGHGPSAVGRESSDLRDSAVARHLTEDVVELEAPLVEKATLRARGCAAGGPATPDVSGARPIASARRETGSSARGIYLHEVDRPPVDGVRRAPNASPGDYGLH